MLAYPAGCASLMLAGLAMGLATQWRGRIQLWAACVKKAELLGTIVINFHAHNRIFQLCLYWQLTQITLTAKFDRWFTVVVEQNLMRGGQAKGSRKVAKAAKAKPPGDADARTGVRWFAECVGWPSAIARRLVFKLFY